MSKLGQLMLASVLVFVMSGCSQRCDCTPVKEQAPVTADNSERLMQDMQQVNSEESPLPDRTMAEASTHVAAEPLSDQLEQLIAEEKAKEQQRLNSVQPASNAVSAVATPATPSLQRRLLPSDMAQGYPSATAFSMYPELPNSRKQLTDYALQLAFKLAGDMQLNGIRVGVSSFVEFDESLGRTNALGNQFAETLATLLPEYGVQVIEFKLTRHLAVGPEGDFALSRDIKKLQRHVGMDYLLVGTLITTRRGVQINTRIVSVSQHQVIAAATTLIPHLVLQQIQP
jgi:TolB-like protein